MVNLADEREEGRKEKEKEDGSSTSEEDGSSPPRTGTPTAKEKDADDAPEVLSSDGVGCRLGGGTPSSPPARGRRRAGRRAKGERLFERPPPPRRRPEETEGSVARRGADAARTPTRVPTRVRAPRRRAGSSPPASFDRDDGASDSARFRRRRRRPLLDLLSPFSSTIFLLSAKGEVARIRGRQVASRSSSDPFDRLYLGAFGSTDPKCFAWCAGRWGDELGEEDRSSRRSRLTGDALAGGPSVSRNLLGPTRPGLGGELPGRTGRHREV